MVKQVVKALDVPKGSMNISELKGNEAIVIKKDDKSYLLGTYVSGWVTAYKFQDVDNSWNKLSLNFDGYQEAIDWALRNGYTVYAGDKLAEILNGNVKASVKHSDLKKGMYVLLRSDLQADTSYGDVSFVSPMNEYKGQIALIDGVYGMSFSITATHWSFSAEMVEKIIDLKPGSKFTLLNDVGCFDEGDTVVIQLISYTGTSFEVSPEDEEGHTHTAHLSDLKPIITDEIEVGDTVEIVSGTGCHNFQKGQLAKVVAKGMGGFYTVKGYLFDRKRVDTQHVYPSHIKLAA